MTVLATGARRANPRVEVPSKVPALIRSLMIVAALATTMQGCGAKTGLLVPCRTELIPVPSEVILLLDDSGSVQPPAGDAGTITDWAALMQALRTTLPMYENRLAFGASYFPVPGQDPCAVADRLGVFPAASQSDAVLTFLGTAPGRGDTPTSAALGVVLSYVTSHPSALPRYVILATDGGANCNNNIPCDACNCGQPGSACCLPGYSAACLDFDAVQDRVSALRAAGALTAAILFPAGMGGPDPSIMADAMDSLALAGGVPDLSGAHHFYPGDGVAELSASLQQLFNAFQSCRFTLPPTTRIDTLPAVSIEGLPGLVQDTQHREGWDWTDAGRTGIQLFGAACDGYRQQPGRVTMVTSLRCELDPHDG